MEGVQPSSPVAQCFFFSSGSPYFCWLFFWKVGRDVTKLAISSRHKNRTTTNRSTPPKIIYCDKNLGLLGGSVIRSISDK